MKKVRECREPINDAAAEVGPPWRRIRDGHSAAKDDDNDNNDDDNGCPKKKCLEAILSIIETTYNGNFFVI